VKADSTTEKCFS